MARPPIDGGTVLITGASSGIGREIARALAPRAGAMVLVARRRERLEQLAQELQAGQARAVVHVRPGDLADTAARDRLLDAIQLDVGDIDVLVNNAGAGDQALLENADWPRLERLIAVGVLAPVHLTQRLVARMVQRRRGRILNIGSGAGFTFMPGNAVYAGSKHFLDGFTESLRAEVASAGVVVTQVAPGPVDTEFDQTAGIRAGCPGGRPSVSASQPSSAPEMPSRASMPTSHWCSPASRIGP